MSKHFIHANHRTTEDIETKKICDFFANFIKAHSVLLTNQKKIRFLIERLANPFSTAIKISHLEDSTISDTLITSYSWDAILGILRKHGGELYEEGGFERCYVVEFRKNKVRF